MDFYDQDGTPTVYLANNQHLYFRNGTPAGYIANDKIYTFQGAIVG